MLITTTGKRFLHDYQLAVYTGWSRNFSPPQCFLVRSSLKFSPITTFLRTIGSQLFTEWISDMGVVLDKLSLNHRSENDFSNQINGWRSRSHTPWDMFLRIHSHIFMNWVHWLAICGSNWSYIHESGPYKFEATFLLKSLDLLHVGGSSYMDSFTHVGEQFFYQHVVNIRLTLMFWFHHWWDRTQ